MVFVQVALDQTHRTGRERRKAASNKLPFLTFRANFVLFFAKRVITVLTPTKTFSSTAVSLELIISARIF